MNRNKLQIANANSILMKSQLYDFYTLIIYPIIIILLWLLLFLRLLLSYEINNYHNLIFRLVKFRTLFIIILSSLLKLFLTMSELVNQYFYLT